MNDTHHSRRHFLASGSAGLSSLALSYLLQQDDAQANEAESETAADAEPEQSEEDSTPDAAKASAD